MDLEALYDPDLRVESAFRVHDLLASDGSLVARLQLDRSPMVQVLEPGFRRRVARGQVEGRDLDTHWSVALFGRPAGHVVHLFPHNLQGAGGRGYELRGPDGRVQAYTVREGSLLKPTLVVCDPTGATEPLRCRTRALKSGLCIRDADGRPLMDLARDLGRLSGWAVVWVRPDLDPESRGRVAAALVLALVWVG